MNTDLAQYEIKKAFIGFKTAESKQDLMGMSFISLHVSVPQQQCDLPEQTHLSGLSRLSQMDEASLRS